MGPISREKNGAGQHKTISRRRATPWMMMAIAFTVLGVLPAATSAAQDSGSRSATLLAMGATS